MYWRIVARETVTPQATPDWEGRFVLHAHRDAEGPHLDLRLEWGDCLLGYRVAGEALAVNAWATEKAPHPKRWLTQDGAAERRDAGRYAWAKRGDTERTLWLEGEAGIETLTLHRERVLAPAVSSGLRAWLAAQKLEEAHLPGLAQDGQLARRTAMGRIHGLARVLEGDAFDAEALETQLRGQPLEKLLAVQQRLETRFDARLSPKPYAQAMPMPEGESTEERDAAPWALLLGSKAAAT